ncbi:aldehyde dehydrogenase (NADP(+)) [Nocardioides sp. AN3]
MSAATKAAEQAFWSYRDTSPAVRSAFLAGIAEEIEADRDAIVEAAVEESRLPEARIIGELGRTTGQLRMFADVVRRGDHLGVRIDPALPDRQPLPRPDLRQRQTAIGPVAVFGASNFPLAFSTAGGDTASALAAGCPVVVKGHPAHPRTGELVAAAVARAVAAHGLHPGVFCHLPPTASDGGVTLGQELISDTRIKAVGFTGSRRGGLAMAAAAAARPDPIPVYAEMSSVNPVVVLAGALGDDPADLAAAYVGSLTLGSGQFCTNPGLVFVPEGPAGDAFVAAAGAAVAQATGQIMLTPGIAAAYDDATARLRAADGVRVIGVGVGGGPDAPAPQLVEVAASALDGPDPVATEEVFGASGVMVRYGSVDELLPLLVRLEGQLSATIHASEADHDAARRLLPVLETKAGRILFNGWPTGVEVCHAIVHGGPFPATTDARTTSVGSLAIQRFQRPVCYQDVPDVLLPDALRQANPWWLSREIDGRLVSASDARG